MLLFPTVTEAVVKTCWVLTALLSEPQNLSPLLHGLQAVCAVVGPLLASKAGTALAEMATAGVDLTTGDVAATAVTVA